MSNLPEAHIPQSTEDVPFNNDSKFQADAIELAENAEGAGAYLGFSEEQIGSFSQEQRQAIHSLEVDLAGDDESSDQDFATKFGEAQSIAEKIAAGDSELTEAFATKNMKDTYASITKAYNAADYAEELAQEAKELAAERAFEARMATKGRAYNAAVNGLVKILEVPDVVRDKASQLRRKH